MFIHAILVVLQILEPHRTAVGCTHKQGDVKGVRETYVEVDDELVKQGVPKRLPKLTPLDSYRMQLETFKYMSRKWPTSRICCSSAKAGGRCLLYAED